MHRLCIEPPFPQKKQFGSRTAYAVSIGVRLQTCGGGGRGKGPLPNFFYKVLIV